MHPTAPCRVYDSRHTGSGQPFTGTLNPPVDVVTSPCNIPATAQAYVFNATVVPSPNLSYLTLWPDGQGQPIVSTLNAADGWITSNMAIVPYASNGDGKIDAYAAGVTQLILDISSYFAPWTVCRRGPICHCRSILRVRESAVAAIALPTATEFILTELPRDFSSSLLRPEIPMSSLRHTLPRVLLCLTVVLISPLLRAQQRIENTLYQFCQQANCTDGADPFQGGLVQDSEGNLYGTTFVGGTHNAGVIFEVSPPPGGSGPWTEKVLYNFCSAAHCADGANPYAGVVFDSRGNLYGTTNSGGPVFDYTHGVAYKLSPPAGGHGPWTETVIYNFCSMDNCPDGDMPESNLIFDGGGNLYGTTSAGGVLGYGMVFKLAPPPGGSGLWTETKLYSFCLIVGCPDGLNPGTANLIFDAQGNLYGTTQFGGDQNDGGIVYRLSPQISPYGLWTETVLHVFCTLCGTGNVPYAGVVLDSQGNLYGATTRDGHSGNGDIYELNPPPGGSGPWNETIIGDFGSYSSLIFDPNGNLYGSSSTVVGGGGIAAELSRSGGTWTESLLYTFCSGYGCAPGLSPFSPLLLDHEGDLYGTAGGGDYGGGAVYELLAGVPTNTNLVTAPNPSDRDQTVVMTATVTAQNGSTPTGTVIFNSDGSQIGSASLNGAGVAVFTDASLPPETYTLTAVYQPSTTWYGSTSNAVIQIVNPWYASTTTVSSSPNPSTVGQSVTFTASVGPSGSPYPTGTVSFTADAAPISGCTGLPLYYSLQVTCTTSSVPVGMNSIVASYSGDSNFGPSSGSMWQIVNPVPTPLQFVTVAPCRLVDTRPQKGGSGPSKAVPR